MNSLYIRAMSQVHLKWNTQRRLRETSRRRLSGTSPRHLLGTSWQHLKRTKQQRLISTSSRRLKHVSNETPNDVSLVGHQDVSVVRIHDVPSVRLYDASCKSQMKHPVTLLRYVSTTSQLLCRDALLVGLWYVFKLPCHDLHLEGFHVSFKYQIKHQNFVVPTRRETRRVVFNINQQNFGNLSPSWIFNGKHSKHPK